MSADIVSTAVELYDKNYSYVSRKFTRVDDNVRSVGALSV